MKVLFVCSSTNRQMHSKIVPFILSQAKSIEDLGHQVDFHTVDKRGFKEYLKSLISLSQKLRKSNYDVIHSHYVYSFCVRYPYFCCRLLLDILYLFSF